MPRFLPFVLTVIVFLLWAYTAYANPVLYVLIGLALITMNFTIRLAIAAGTLYREVGRLLHRLKRQPYFSSHDLMRHIADFLDDAVTRVIIYVIMLATVISLNIVSIDIFRQSEGFRFPVTIEKKRSAFDDA